MLYRQEFLCEFTDEATAFLTYDQITACEDPSLVPFSTVEPLTRESRELFVGVDVGRVRDLTVVWVLARDGDRLVNPSPTLSYGKDRAPGPVGKTADMD